MIKQQLGDKHITPKSKVSFLRKKLSQGVVTDSPFRSIPCFSTPPSRFSRILNPFEPQMVDRLHLPTFSPSVFMQNSTPKTEAKFKWTIDEISSLQPAEIDETTVSLHACTEDSKTEVVVQKKIDMFFRESQIAPSPMNLKANYVPLLKDCDFPKENLDETVEENVPKKQTREGATQTVLTLPPILPKEVEDALRPYFICSDDQHQVDDDEYTNDALYQQLFEFKPSCCPESPNGVESLVSSPPTSLGQLSVQYSPCSKEPDTAFDNLNFEDCKLSPISKTPPRKPLHLFGSPGEERMSVDTSLIVPDMDNEENLDKTCYQVDGAVGSSGSDLPDTSANWSMEYKHISIVSPSLNSDAIAMDLSNSSTPHSKLYVGKGQRKRLSDSFKIEENGNGDNGFQVSDVSMKSRGTIGQNKLGESDFGYYTHDTGDFSNTSVFASTPSKRNRSLPCSEPN
ncbi:protein aurora borealis isoform X1 [Dendroctonus ponderosae]|nr:protein aurora borealis isoform X1 [Dendroctonus ponderosae]